jgi:hypothetical protein
LGLPGLHTRVIYSKEELQVRRGIALTLLFSLAILFGYYGNLLLSPNTTYFGNKGDGLQSYFGTIYQLRHDSTYWHMSGMNYPYGENSFFTGNQPLLTAGIKLISNTIYDISPYAVGIINLTMLIGLIVCALCIFSIFHYLKVHWLYAALSAVAITFLSPQVHRMGGHFSLAYPFAIPLFIYLLLKFSEAQTLKRSVKIGLLTFFMAGTHLYFFGIFAMMLILYYGIGFIRKEEWFKGIKPTLLHFSIQSIIPFAIIWLLVNLNNPVADRPQSPWGFLVYKTNWKAVFLPVNRPLSEYFERYFDFSEISWEAQAYAGFFAGIFCITLALVSLVKIKAKEFRKIYELSPNPVINALFWSSIVGLIYSFGIPFIYRMEFLLDYLGMVKQMRGIGRFSWVFFFMANITGIYLFYHWAMGKSLQTKSAIFALPLLLLFYDGWTSVRAHEYYLNNKIDRLSGVDAEYEALLKTINNNHYQAIVPLPCFAVGSENIWAHPDDNLINETLILSMRSGIPTTGSLLARTSISQTFKRLQLAQEPYVEPALLKELSSPLPFLIIANEELLTSREKEILTAAKHIASISGFSLFEISPENLLHANSIKAHNIQEEFSTTQFFELQQGLMAKDVDAKVFYNSFEESKGNSAYIGNGSYKGFWRDYHHLAHGPFPANSEAEYTLSFWFYGYQKDLFPRATMELTLTDTTAGKSEKFYIGAHSCLRLQDGDWALMEWQIKPQENFNYFHFGFYNKEAGKNEAFMVDELLFRPSETDIFKKEDKLLIKNNRRYKLN